MADYTLEGVKWVVPSQTVTWSIATANYADRNIQFASFLPSDFQSDLQSAFARWSSVANIHFVEVADSDTADIRFGFEPIDGRYGVVGVTQYSDRSSGSGLSPLVSADIAFDSDEGWTDRGGPEYASGNFALYPFALHEIGHALGLDHYNAAPAAMNAVIDLNLSDLTTSDIHGVQALYGASGGNLFGATVHDVSGFGGEVYALYDALLDRTPDTLGFENYVDALYSGASLHDVAASLLGSPEGQSHLGASDNTGFVQQLYQTALHRSADAGGLKTYVDALNGGASRADVAIDIALSTENVNGLQGALNAGVFVPDANAAGVARLYYGVLGRAPDSGGLTTYTAAVDAGTSLHDVAQAFLGSTEYQSSHGGANGTQFVQSLYQGALGRQADAGGLQNYVNALNDGTSRATVAMQIAESPEARNHLLPAIEKGFQLA